MEGHSGHLSIPIAFRAAPFAAFIVPLAAEVATGSVAAKEGFSLPLKIDSTGWALGSDGVGQLFDDAAKYSRVPMAVAPIGAAPDWNSPPTGLEIGTCLSKGGWGRLTKHLTGDDASCKETPSPRSNCRTSFAGSRCSGP